jgi:DNA-binding FadR family transcriptional regulator
MPLPLSSSRSLALDIAERIAELITDLEPGTRLGTKTELREKWGVAAATLNEALRLLQSRGAIRLRTGPNGGVFVATPDPLVRIGQALVSAHGNATSIVDAVALRDVLDPLTVLEAARYRTAADVRELRAQLERMRDALPDDTAFVQEIWELHRVIARIGRNEMLREISLGLLEILASQTDFVVAGSKSRAQKEARLAVHERLVDAIESGDLSRCAKASQDHSLAEHSAAEADESATMGARTR